MTISTMHKSVVPVVLTVFLQVVSSQVLPHSEVGDTIDHQLSPGKPTVLSIGRHDNTTLTLTLTGVSPEARFVVVQVYAHRASLILTQTSAAPPGGGSESGRGVGMVQTVSHGDTQGLGWTVGVVEDSVRGEGDFPVSVLAVVQEYGDGAPVPGGCNQVFTLETDPNLRVTPDLYHSQVWFQWANVATPPGNKPAGCEDRSVMGQLSYQVYVAFTPETDDGEESLFRTLKSVSSVQDLQRNAMEVIRVENDGNQKSLVKVTSNRGQGSVYGIVVTDTRSGHAASYVAAVSYACNYTAGDCSLKDGVLEWVMLVTCGVTGMILLLLGHQFIKTEMAVIGFVAVTLMSFTFLSLAHTLSDPVRLGISAVLGVVGGGAWLLVWVAFTFPSISVLLPGLCAGFLVAGSLFFTPFANISWWATNINYGLVCVCVTLLFGVLFLCSPRTLNIVSCSLVGGYCVTMLAAIPLRSSLRLIVLYVIRHASVADYASVVVVSPFLTNDIVLAVVWAGLAVLGVAWQFYWARGKPHFPSHSPRRPPHSLPRRHQVRGHRKPTSDPVNDHHHDDEDERTPLLGSQQPPPYYHDSSNPLPPSAPSETNRPM